MTNSSSNQTDILPQIIQLYEFSLAVGNSTNLEENCRHFFDRILARRNLSYAALWIQKSIDKPDEDLSLSYSNPKGEFQGPEIIDKNLHFLKQIITRQIFSIDRETLNNSSWVDRCYIPNGDSFTFINLPEIGFIILAGYGQRGLWEPWQLSQMKPIFNSFASSIRSSIHFEQLQVEIVERKNAEQKAIQANETKSQFLANMSHELRTPLNAVLGISELLRDTELDTEQLEFVDTILNSGKSLLQLINDTLDFSKLEAKKIILENIHFDLHETMNSIHQLFRDQCRVKSLGCIVNIDKNLSKYFIGDPLRIKQILLNLISNSIKFTHQGKISINLQQTAFDNEIAHIKFSVTDTGIGIDQANQHQLFECFHQVDTSTTRKFGGTGLGLSICKQLVELMQGSISVESQIDNGSEFSFTIPLQFSFNTEARLQTKKQSPTVINKQAKILLVEDDKVNQMVAQKLLQSLGLPTDIAENGQEAIQLLQNKEYELVFMDMQMPKMGGLEATRLIRQKNSGVINPDVTIIAMTANAMESDRHLCLQAGMNDYLSKPVSKEALIKKLDIWI